MQGPFVVNESAAEDISSVVTDFFKMFFVLTGHLISCWFKKKVRSSRTFKYPNFNGYFDCLVN